MRILSEVFGIRNLTTSIFLADIIETHPYVNLPTCWLDIYLYDQDAYGQVISTLEKHGLCVVDHIVEPLRFGGTRLWVAVLDNLRNCQPVLVGECDNCGDYRILYFDALENWSCYECLPRCVECGEIILYGQDHFYDTEEGEFYCSVHAPRCPECNERCYGTGEDFYHINGNWFHSRCVYYCTGCDEYVPASNYCNGCGSCYECCTCWDDDDIRPYDYIPSEFLFFKTRVCNPLYLGIEFEIEPSNKTTRTDLAKDIIDWFYDKDYQDLVYLKHDGSLNNGFEIVFHPCTRRFLLKELPLREFLSFLKSEGALSWVTGRCGVHIHVERAAIKDSEYKKCNKINNLMSALYPFIIESLCGRKESHANQWCERNEIKRPPIRYDARSKYLAVNFYHSQTFELRIFRGTLKYERFRAYLAFTEALVKFLNLHSVFHIYKMTCESPESLYREFRTMAVDLFPYLADYMPSEPERASWY